MKHAPDAARKNQLFSGGGGAGRTSVFLHYRMDRALRAIIYKGKMRVFAQKSMVLHTFLPLNSR